MSPRTPQIKGFRRPTRQPPCHEHFTMIRIPRKGVLYLRQIFVKLMPKIWNGRQLILSPLGAAARHSQRLELR